MSGAAILMPLAPVRGPVTVPCRIPDHAIGCRSKAAYLTEGRARRTIRTMVRMRSFRRDPLQGHLRPYHCRHCGYWHVGNGS